MVKTKVWLLCLANQLRKLGLRSWGVSFFWWVKEKPKDTVAFFFWGGVLLFEAKFMCYALTSGLTRGPGNYGGWGGGRGGGGSPNKP